MIWFKKRHEINELKEIVKSLGRSLNYQTDLISDLQVEMDILKEVGNLKSVITRLQTVYDSSFKSIHNDIDSFQKRIKANENIQKRFAELNGMKILSRYDVYLDLSKYSECMRKEGYTLDSHFDGGHMELWIKGAPKTTENETKEPT